MVPSGARCFRRPHPARGGPLAFQDVGSAAAVSPDGGHDSRGESRPDMPCRPAGPLSQRFRLNRRAATSPVGGDRESDLLNERGHGVQKVGVEYDGAWTLSAPGLRNDRTGVMQPRNEAVSVRK